MRTLAIETSSDVCSVALFDDDSVIASDRLSVGRGHAEQLIPMIAALPGGGRADAIRVGCGPGSFTGIRVGIAAARALAFAWGVPVQGFGSLALIAATWFADHDENSVTVAINGGHGQIFVQQCLRDDEAGTGFSVQSRDAVPSLAQPIAGDVTGDAVRPDALYVMLIPGDPIAVRPIYGRPPDAKPMVA